MTLKQKSAFLFITTMILSVLLIFIDVLAIRALIVGSMLLKHYYFIFVVDLIKKEQRTV